MDQMDNLERRLREQLAALFEGNESELARRVGTDQQNINNFITGKVKRSHLWREISAALDIPESEMRELLLQRGRSEGKNTKLPNTFRTAEHLEQPNATVGGLQPPAIGRPRMLPVLGEAVGGDNGEYIFNGQALDYVPCPPLLANVPNAYVVFVDGESMVPRYMPGEVAFVHPGKPPRKNDHVVVQLKPTSEDSPPRGFIKRFLGWTPTKLRLQQYNPHKEIEFDKEEVVSVHQIVLAGDY